MQYDWGGLYPPIRYLTIFENKGTPSTGEPTHFRKIDFSRAIHLTDLASVPLPFNTLLCRIDTLLLPPLNALPDQACTPQYGAKNSISCLIFTSNTAIGSNTFWRNSGLREVDMRTLDIEAIPAECFYGCSSLATVRIPATVKEIQRSAFTGCSSLRSIDLPDGLKEIHQEAFTSCTRLTSFTFPASVEVIGENFLLNNSQLTTCVFRGNTIRSIGNYAFRGTSIQELDLSKQEKLTEIPHDCFPKTLKVLKLPRSIRNIQSTAFYSCSSLHTLQLPILKPIPVDYQTFYLADRNILRIYVPAPSIELYEHAEHWKAYYFTGIDGLLSLTVKSKDPLMGNVSGDTVFWEPAEAIIEALPRANHVFQHWDDGNRDNPRTVQVTEDRCYTAFFSQEDTPLPTTTITQAHVYVQDGRLCITGTDKEYSVYDTTGKRVYHGREYSLKLPHGIYIVRLGTESQKIPVNP